MKMNLWNAFFVGLSVSLPLQAAIHCKAPEWDSVSLDIAGDGSARIDLVVTPQIKFAKELKLPSNGVTYPFITASLRFPKGTCRVGSEDPALAQCFLISPKGTTIEFSREKISRVLDSARVEITKNHVETVNGKSDFYQVTWQLHDEVTRKDITESRVLDCQAN